MLKEWTRGRNNTPFEIRPTHIPRSHAVPSALVVTHIKQSSVLPHAPGTTPSTSFQSASRKCSGPKMDVSYARPGNVKKAATAPNSSLSMPQNPLPLPNSSFCATRVTPLLQQKWLTERVSTAKESTILEQPRKKKISYSAKPSITPQNNAHSRFEATLPSSVLPSSSTP
ncbi:hypothetical protein BDR05DRAFT_1006864 [Suillus weaverae]|nr:hypothetical protein BDR05DRAFT_1006864 [Suillus weaverae]